MPDKTTLKKPTFKHKSLLVTTGVQGKKLRIGENEYAAQQLNCTLEAIRLHNSHCDGYDEGWKAAMDYVREQHCL